LLIALVFIFLPLVWLILALRFPFSNVVFAVLVGAVAYVLTIASVMVGGWGIFGYGFRLLLIVVGFSSIPIWLSRILSLPVFAFGSVWEWVLIVVALVFLLAGTGILWLVFAHGSQMPKPIKLAFPFGAGVYYIGQGGISETLNYHMAHKHMLYAIDLGKLRPLGFRANGLYPSNSSQYAIFGDVLYSPCDGTITAARNDAPDFNPPETDEKQPLGNHIFLLTGEVKIVMAHLQQGSVLVQVGDCVKRGQPLARIGNSGNTTEPHLHIHAERGGAPDQISSGECIPMYFDGRFLKRNDLVYRNKPPS
jgi:Peptidase family M23